MLAEIDAAIADVPADQPGIRLFGNAAASELVGVGGEIAFLAGRLAKTEMQPVRAILFDKSPSRNWALGWHQDRTIAVQERCEVPGFTAWTIKNGTYHVSPPVRLLQRMITLRIHLDPVGPQNAPLLIAPGSQRAGVIREADLDAVVRRCGSHACLAERGDIWAYATLIVHASERSVEPRRRRVLQVDYSPDVLQDGLRWAGLV